MKTILLITVAAASAVAMAMIIKRARFRGMVGVPVYDPLCSGEPFSGELPPGIYEINAKLDIRNPKMIVRMVK